jgi:hypothetical protein
MVFFGTPGISHASALDDERSYFSEYGVEYCGYIFAPLNNEIVKIPRNKDKVKKNAEFVMDFPENTEAYAGYDEKRIFTKNDGNLYINFWAYMVHGGLFRLTPGSDKPEFVVKASSNVGGFHIEDSKRHPETMKFLYFGEGDAGTSWGDLYGYLPGKNKAVRLMSYRGVMKTDDLIGITRDDAVLASQFVYGSDNETNRLEGLRAIMMDPETGEVKTQRLLEVKDMPKTYFITPGSDLEKLYLFGAGLSVYDVKNGSLRKVFAFNEIIKNWPDNGYPYSDDAHQYLNQYYGSEDGKDAFMFVIDQKRPGRFYICGNNQAARIDAFNETYERVKDAKEIKGKDDRLW